MGVKIDCPWCDFTAKYNSYPASSAMLKAHRELKSHCRQKHQNEREEYQRIINVWEQKVRGDGAEFYLNAIKDVLNDDSFHGKPKPTIVNQYSAEELGRMNKDELMKIFVQNHIQYDSEK